MRILDIQNNIVVINAECLIIPEFKTLWDLDKSDKKDIAFKEISWVYFMGHYNTIYKSYDSEVRQEIVSEDIFKDKKYKPSKEVLDALKRYKEFQSTPSLRFLESCEFAMEKMDKYLHSTNFEKLDKNGKPLYKFTEVSRGIKEAPGIIDALAKTKEKVLLEQQTTSKIKAGGVEGLLADMD